MKIFGVAWGYHSLDHHHHNSRTFLYHGDIGCWATVVNMEARQPTSLVSQSSSMKAKLRISKTALMNSTATSSNTHDAQSDFCTEFP